MTDKRNALEELHRLRQNTSIKLYYLLMAIGLVGAVLSILTDAPDRTYDSSFILSMMVGSIALSYLIVYASRRFVKKMAVVDLILFVIGIFLYITTIINYIGNRFMPLLLFYPIFLLLFTLGLNKLYILFFIIINLLQVTYYLVKKPVSIVEIDAVHYITFTAVLLMSASVTFFMMRLIEGFQEKLIEDNDALQDRNQKLSDLNDAYIASQTALETQYIQIEQLAFTDALTGLLNRAGFIKELSAILSLENVNLSILILDLTNFSELNSAYGLEIGDEVLKTTASAIKETSLIGDQYARIGNDIFAFTFISENLEADIQKCLSAIPREIQVDDDHIMVTFKAGVAYMSQVVTSAEDLLKHADVALTEAKNKNTNYVIYDTAMNERFQKQISLKSSLATAIRNESLHMVYQPIINARTMDIEHFEALSRWKDDVLGFVAPNIFIPLAENTQLIRPLSMVTNKMILDFADHLIHEEAIATTISINASSKQLTEIGFAESLIEGIKDHHLAPSDIAVEITETSLIDDFDVTIKELNILRDYGVKIYLDDFGTGYSSLNYLDQLPIDVLKIDKSFVDELEMDERRVYLLENVISLAKKLRIQTVAEGVETQKQFERLQQLGIDYLQGYYFAKPMGEADVVQHYRAYMKGLAK